MRFVPVKSEETQGAAMVFRIREFLIRQRTQAINSLRGHLTGFGQIVPQGAANVRRLIAIVEDPESGLPTDAIATLRALIAALNVTSRLAPPAGFRREALSQVHSDVANDVSYARRGDAG